MLYKGVEKLHRRLSRSVVLVRVAICRRIDEAHQQKRSQECAPTLRLRTNDSHPRKPSAKPQDVGADCGSPIVTPSAVTIAIWNCAPVSQK